MKNKNLPILLVLWMLTQSIVTASNNPVQNIAQTTVAPSIDSTCNFVLEQALEELAKQHRKAHGSDTHCVEGLIESGISIYTQKGAVKVSRPFYGRLRQQITNNEMKFDAKAIAPEQFFEVLPKDATLVAALHTHPPGPFSLYPSVGDMLFSNTKNVPIYMVSQCGKRYRVYHSNGALRPTKSFLDENGLLRKTRDHTTLAYSKYVEDRRKEFTSKQLKAQATPSLEEI